MYSEQPAAKQQSGLLAEAVLEGAAEHGGKAEVIRLVERNINPCHGCFACTRSDRGCVQHDGMTDLYPLIASADALVMLPLFIISTCPVSSRRLSTAASPWTSGAANGPARQEAGGDDGL